MRNHLAGRRLRHSKQLYFAALAAGLALVHWSAHAWMMLADEQATPEQIEIFRAMPGEKRLRLAEGLYWSARQMKMAGLRAQHPDWPEERLKNQVRRIFLHARS